MIIGIILAIAAGLLVGLQNIFNRHLNMKVNSWAATAFILFTGSLASLILGLLFSGTEVFDLSGMKLAYWFFGFVGIGLMFSMMTAMRKIGPTKAVVISVISQLSFSLIFDMVGLLSLPVSPIRLVDVIGLLLMFLGIYIFSYEKKVKVLKEKKSSSN